MRASLKITKLIGGILANLANCEGVEAWHNPERDLRCVAERDYAPSLRALLARATVAEVIRAAREIFPDLNRQHKPDHIEGWVKGDSTSGLRRLFAQVRERRDIHFQGTPFTGEGGLALRGFFVDRDGESLKRPLIYVNTAHHPVAVAATLFHEVGHLVASEVFDSRDSSVHFFFDVDYASHLEDVGELTADVVLSLAAYPAPVAREIFSTTEKSLLRDPTAFPDQLLARIIEHYRTHFGMNLPAADLPATRKLNYLGGMIHFAKLRAALLTEYDL